MPPAYDDEADYEYHDEVPEFQDEAEFDDYMNDEEYNLMSEMFPRATKELTDYQGWDNLKVKLAIFDHEFDYEEAMIDLKRTLKKKKTEKPQPKMSALERLARDRAKNFKKTQETSTDVPTRLNKLSSLQRQTKDTASHASSPASRLAHLAASTRNKPSQKYSGPTLSADTEKNSNALVEPRNTGSSSKSRMTLVSRLSDLRKTHRKDHSAAENVSVEETTKPEFKAVPRLTPAISQDLGFGELTKNYNLLHFSSQPSEEVEHLHITKIVVGSDAGPVVQDSRLKRKHSEVFSVYYPDTNKQTAKRQALNNFQKKSPDDVVMEAQKRAFEATKGIESLSLDKSNPANVSKGNAVPKNSLSEDEEDDRPFEAEPKIRTYKKATVATKPKKPVDLQAFIASKKPHLSFVVIGHVDAGKSTLMGRLLYDVGAVDNKLIRKLKRESEMIGKSSFHLAWVMDQTAEERNRGVTVDICTSDFETEHATFTIVDAPGHRDFVPNAIAGVSQVDVAVLSIDCSTDAFESGFNLDGQTKEHTLLARSLGIRHIVVAMNKMDSVDWYEGRFTDIKFELLQFFEDIGIKSEQVSWVPCSGLSGEGVYKTKYPAGQTWYNGPSLVESLEEISKVFRVSDHHDILEKPFLFSILDVVPGSKGNDAILSGKVESGSIQGGETITIFPSEQSVVVDQILTGNAQTPTPAAIRGDFVSVKVRNAFVDDIQSGDIAAVVGYDIGSAQEFSAQLLTFKLDRPLLPGTPFMFFRGSCEQPARVKKLISLVDKADPARVVKKKVKHLGSNQAAVIEIELVEKKRRIPMLTIEQNKHLGRIVLRKEGRTIAAGVVKTLEM
ncbi:LADA_0A01222g1_1 [Lachancea dasiensis]|uniref:Elongation factor 1 alpha-like protein n=1 Tax=Lachancea dasiensis TaxID=1072105 RepID=A0A1G4IMD3_9SACH|nr:LADA_0A01222g1_1 [Lachancea dasiensis]